MLQTLYLLAYNNYYNRIVKTEATLGDYYQYLVSDPIEVNFNPGDGINTVHVLNQSLPTADYLVVTDGSNTIVSRWFVIHTVRNLRGQYTLTLRRDIIADKLDKVLSTPCFIEKGIVSDNDFAIFNGEDMTFSQIKKGETLLKDASGCAWIVGYYARNTGEAITELEDSFDPENVADITLSTPLTDWEYYSYVGSNKSFKQFPTRIDYTVNFEYRYGGIPFESLYFSFRDVIANPRIDTLRWERSGGIIGFYMTQSWTEFYSKLDVNSQRTSLQTQAGEVLGFKSQSDTLDFRNLQGKIVLDSTGTYYQIGIVSTNKTIDTSVTAGTLRNTLRNIMTTAGATSTGNDTWTVSAQLSDSYLTATPLVSSSVVKYKIQSNRNHLQDAPYDAFAIPYSDSFKVIETGNQFTTQKDIGLNVAMQIARKYAGASGVLYDVQLLPYCPFVERLSDPGEYRVTDAKAVSYITQGTSNVHVGVIFNLSVSQFRTSIPFNLSISNVKVDSLTKFIRFCSPNYNGVFEMTPAKNQGINGINITCTYKPYTPYIQVAPQFAGLYGGDYGDARGLICGGDFSLPSVTDQWQTYEIQHKNYAAIFDRQIENMEVNNSVQRERERWAMAAGVVGGASQGLNAGMYASAGNPVGMAVGAVVGAGASLAGGLRDLELAEELRNETLDYTRDMYGYNLGNIRALPNTLNKVSAFNINNKIFPFIEYYESTEQERLALIRKIKYNGMSVMRIGILSDYQWTWSAEGVSVTQPYLKGKIIRLEDLQEDYTVAKAIAYELNLGVFIDGITNPGSA